MKSTKEQRKDRLRIMRLRETNFGRFLAIVFIVGVVAGIVIALLDYLLPGTVGRTDKIQQMYSEHLLNVWHRWKTHYIVTNLLS